jgi:Synergist-CTERM protein sorting domain-containing protein
MKRLLLFLMVAVFVVMSGGAVWAIGPDIGDNWGDVRAGSGEDYFYHEGGTGPDDEINLYIHSDRFSWSTFFLDCMVIRTTQASGSISHDSNWTESYSLSWGREAEEFEIGDFTADLDSETPSYTWDFTGVDGRALAGCLYALSQDIEMNLIEVTSLDFVVAKVEENPTFDIFVGVQGIPESLRPFGPISSTDDFVDLGLIIMDLDDVSHPKMDVVFANFWNQQVQITNIDPDEYAYQIFAPDLYEDEEPGFVTVTSPDIVDPALAAHFHLPNNTVPGSSFDITFESGNTLSLTWLWAAQLDEMGPNAVGLIPMVSSSDINDDIDPDVDYVLNGEEDGASISAGSYTLVTSADADNYIAQIEVSADVPADKQDGLAVLPLGIRMAVDVDQVAVYSEELDSAISEEFGEELPTENQITEAVRKHVAFTKEWSDGTTAEIQLDDEDFKDAVDIWVEFDDEGEAEFVFLTVNLLIVNGGEPGMVDSATVNDRDYIVIYDGELDDKFADPLKLTAATVESDDGDSATSGGGSGCSALGFVPGVALLLLPLWMLRRK